jgi:hypothetical protein
VSDFVSRVAARAVGQAARAQPRLPSLFEQSGPGPAPLELVEETIAPTPTSRRPAARAAAPERGRASEDSPAAPSPRLEPAPTAPGPERRPFTASADSVRAASSSAQGESVEPAVAEPVASVPPASPIAPVAEQVAAVAAPAQPIARAAPAPAPPPAAPAGPEQRSVRVHIGRLEVRAALQETPVVQRPREQPRAPELSLGDYLRGRRAGS